MLQLNSSPEHGIRQVKECDALAVLSCTKILNDAGQ